MTINYKKFIEDNFQLVSKELKLIDFRLNRIQDRYIQHATWNDVILKARQQGFSSLIDAILTTDFILQENSYSVILADSDENAEILLARVKKYIESYQNKNKIEIKMKYETTSMLFNEFMNSRITIGTAKNTEFGRSRTISGLHCSEVAFYPNVANILSGAGEAVIPGGKKIFETTANGFNEFKEFYDEAKNKQNGYNAFFFKASDYYSPEFLAEKRKNLKNKFPQEYPESDIECFLASGDCYFDTDILKRHFNATREPMESGSKGLIYV